MKKLRTWAWPDLQAVNKRVQHSSFGSGFWKHKQIRIQREFIARQVMQQLCNPAFVVLKAAATGEADTPAPAAPVVH